VREPFLNEALGILLKKVDQTEALGLTSNVLVMETLGQIPGPGDEAAFPSLSSTDHLLLSQISDVPPTWV
jgi:hypothetical protein